MPSSLWKVVTISVNWLRNSKDRGLWWCRGKEMLRIIIQAKGILFQTPANLALHLMLFGWFPLICFTQQSQIQSVGFWVSSLTMDCESFSSQLEWLVNPTPQSKLSTPLCVATRYDRGTSYTTSTPHSRQLRNPFIACQEFITFCPREVKFSAFTLDMERLNYESPSKKRYNATHCCLNIHRITLK